MLVEFTIGNYLSIKDKKTLSLEATPITEFPDNVIAADKLQLLKSAVIYGANSSGKSNFLNALIKMQKLVLESAKQTSTDKIPVFPFLLNSETEHAPSYFEVLFLIGTDRFRYGFEADKVKIHSEWLFVLKNNKKKETVLFVRNQDDFDISKHFSEGNGLAQKTRDNALFLSTVDQFNGTIANQIMKWFDNFTVLSGLEHQKDRELSLMLMKQNRFSERFKKFLYDFNLGFTGLTMDENDSDVLTTHNKYNTNNELIDHVLFSLTTHESSGTNKLFDLAGYIWGGLLIGKVVIIDELDAKLHPLLTQAIVKLFNSIQSNPKNAQLLFATHDTNLLTFGDFRRDQIYFVEKDNYEATDLYSLVEYRDSDDVKIRKDSSYEKDYIKGRYGAIPFVGDFSSLLN